MTPHPKKVKPKFKTVKAWAILDNKNIMHSCERFKLLEIYKTRAFARYGYDKELPLNIIEVEIRIPIKRGKR